MWRDTVDDLLKILFDLFYRMAAERGTDGRGNTRYLRDLNLVGRLLQILHHEDNNSSGGVVTILGASARETHSNLLGWLLHNSPLPVEFHSFDPERKYVNEVCFLPFSLNPFQIKCDNA